MQTGTKISATLHVGLVGWALLGGAFRSEPLPLEVQEVSVISAAEFEALSARPATPEVSSEPVALQQPEPAQDAPALEPAEDTPPVAEPAPEPVVVPEPEPAPVTPPPPDPTPEPEVADAPATLVPLPEVAPEPPVSAPLATLRPRSRPAERVAPTPVAPPPPETAPDPVVREQVAEADTGDSFGRSRRRPRPPKPPVTGSRPRPIRRTNRPPAWPRHARSAPARGLHNAAQHSPPPTRRPRRPIPRGRTPLPMPWPRPCPENNPQRPSRLRFPPARR